mmetsp:Transcript_28195/g.34833  ORF Transcript_28195/g.34833 Transcript_28195/m.34833 type:complete len:211 (+) Transcript_28195:3013-3645(+)
MSIISCSFESITPYSSRLFAITIIFILFALTPLATSRRPITSLLRAFAFLSSFDRSCSLVNSPNISYKRGVAVSFSDNDAYDLGRPVLGIFGTRLHSAYCSGMILSPEYMGAGFASSSFLQTTDSKIFFLPTAKSLTFGNWLAIIFVPPNIKPLSSCTDFVNALDPSAKLINICPFLSPFVSKMQLVTLPYLDSNSSTSLLVSSIQSSSS